MTSTNPSIGEWPAFTECLPGDPIYDILVDPQSVEVTELGALYDRNRPDLVEPLENPTIPRIIHQIWLGSPLPKKLARYSRSWRKQHPEWEFKLWTDKEVADFDFPSRALFDEATCWGQKSDLLRMEILKKEGGVYVDLDYQCFQPIDVLVARYDFFSTLKYIYTAHVGWPDVWQKPIVACNSLIGARPQHPILSAYLEEVSAAWNNRERYQFREDELLPIAVAAMGGKAKASQIKETGVRTFIPYGDVVGRMATEGNDRNIVLPPVFFNPVMSGARTLYLMPDFWMRCRNSGLKWPRLGIYSKPHRLSLGSHISENSWV
jgi:hypothetical protein